MSKQRDILFIQGGGGEEDYVADRKLVNSLQQALGSAYTVHYPNLPNESSPDFGRKKQIKKEIASLNDGVILVGHSLGASMLLKYLSEEQLQKNIAGLFLIATPFWSGDEDWKQDLKLNEDFADKLPKHLPTFLYHSKDDEEVPFDHLSIYKEHLPQATARVLQSRGHHLNNDLTGVAKDIASL